MIIDKKNNTRIPENKKEEFYEEIRQDTEADLKETEKQLKELKKAKKNLDRNKIVEDYKNMLNNQIKNYQKQRDFRKWIIKEAEKELNIKDQ